MAAQMRDARTPAPPACSPNPIRRFADGRTERIFIPGETDPALRVADGSPRAPLGSRPGFFVDDAAEKIRRDAYGA
jgi:hypothetical protein